jgi:hypothetical protein
MIGVDQLEDCWGWRLEDLKSLVDKVTAEDVILLYGNVTLDSSNLGGSHAILCGPTRTIASVEEAPKTFDPQGEGAPSTTEVLIGQIDVDDVRRALDGQDEVEPESAAMGAGAGD